METLAQVEYIGEDRKTSSLDGCFQRLTPSRQIEMEAMALDVQHYYVCSILEYHK